jgi:putative membrane-bound dehydrogenase-like protein
MNAFIPTIKPGPNRRRFLLVLFAMAPLLLAAEDKPGVKFLTPTEAIAKMTYPEGFQVVPFAAEPEIVQPFAFTFDDRGRVWLCENMNYETRGSDSFDEGPKGRIVILEDTDGDGRMDVKKLFADKLFFPTGIAFGFGGVWVGSPPNLLFIPDRNGDDIPDAEAEIVLDGWGRQDRHETMNSFMWGPDGWLYGLHGVFTHSKVGKPGTPDAERVPINAGVWRYHPTRMTFEVFAWGTSNPWGMDFDAHGQVFITACVIPHLWHMIQGGRYHRHAGKHFNPHIYNDIKTIADHRHASAHGGARFYLADQFPEAYRGRLFMCNIHEHGVLTDVITRRGSGFSGAHGDSFSMANDKQWLGFNMELGPDGSMYVLDWHDEDICGRKVIHRDTGRLWRISYGDAKNPAFNLADQSVDALAKLAVEATNEWHSRQARRILQERHAAGAIKEEVRAAMHRNLVERLKGETPVAQKLRALWTLHITGGSSGRLLDLLLGHPEEYVRAWAIQLLAEDGEVSAAVLGKWVAMARDDASPVVRLYLASAVQRIPEAVGWPILENLALHETDRDDHNLPLMYWYALEPLVMSDPTRAIDLAGKTKIDMLAQYVARRISSEVVPFKAAAPDDKFIKALPSDSVSDEGLRLHLSVEALAPESSTVERWGDVAQTQEAARPVLHQNLAGRKAMVFDGEDDYFELAHRDELAFSDTNDFTLAAWVYPEAENSGWRGVVTKARDGGPWYGLWIHGKQWRSGASKGPTLHGPDAKSGWEHVAIVQQAGALRMYVDGYLAKTGGAVEGSGKGGLWIGGAASTKEFFRGGINEVRIYGRALSAGEVSYLADHPVAVLSEPSKPKVPANDFSTLIGMLGQMSEPRLQTAMLSGIREGLAGNSNVAVPDSWSGVFETLSRSPNAHVVRAAEELGVLFGDEPALAKVRKAMLNADQSVDERRKAIETLVQRRAKGLAADLHPLLDHAELRDVTLRALTVVPDKTTPSEILKRYSGFSPSEKLHAVNTLAVRAESGLALLGAIESKAIPRTDVNPAAARQLANLGDAAVSKKLAAVWGSIRPKQARNEIREHYEKILKQGAIAKADLVKGRIVYQNLCGQCHRLHDAGGKLAPDLTGSDRRNLTYILDNVLDPNADIGKDYEYTTFTLEDSRVLLGVVVGETDNAVTINTLEGAVTVAKGGLKKREQLPVSMMPEGLFQTLTDEAVRDLVRYLQSDAQVPLPPEKE